MIIETRTNEVYVVSDAEPGCICSPISYRELCIRRCRQTIPIGIYLDSMSKKHIDTTYLANHEAV